MSSGKLAGIIVACTIAIVVTIVLVAGSPPPPPPPPPPPTPASFSVSGLGIHPREISTGEEITMRVLVRNEGDVAGSYQVVFKIDSRTVATRDIQVAGGSSQTVDTTAAVHLGPGEYSADVNGLSGSFSVRREPEPVAMNVRIDYIAIKDAMGRVRHGEDPLYGYIQLIAVVSDGKNEPQAWYIPQQAPGGLEGYRLPDYGRMQLDEKVYRADSVGDYLRVSVLAYSIGSRQKLVSDADVLAMLGSLVGMPEMRIFQELVKLIPVEDVRVGGYERAWTSGEGYGIGHHEVWCRDKDGRENLLLGFSIWSDSEPPPLRVPSTVPGLPESQTLRDNMPPDTWSGSSVSYRRALMEGETVTGTLELTGYYSSNDWDSRCCLRIYDPEGNEVYSWCGRFGMGGLRHDFSFTAKRSGVHAIRVRHLSWWSRQLEMVVSPYGWR